MIMYEGESTCLFLGGVSSLAFLSPGFRVQGFRMQDVNNAELLQNSKASQAEKLGVGELET